MPTRMLRDWTDSYAVNELDAGAERMFLRLIMKADDYGRFHADPRLIRSTCFPLKDDVRDTDISRWLAACEKAGLVRCYTGPVGRKYLEIRNFNQRLRLKRPKFPAPPSDDGQMTGICRPEEEVEEKRREENVVGADTPTAGGPPVISDAQWLGLLRNDSAYEGIDVDREHAKMVRWCETNSKKPSRRRFVNWLNRCERPMAGNGHAPVPAAQPVPRFAQIKAIEATIAQKRKELPGIANRTLYPDEYEADVKRRAPFLAEIKQLESKLAELRAQEAA